MTMVNLIQNLFHSTNVLFYQSRESQLTRIHQYDLVRYESGQENLVDPKIVYENDSTSVP